MPDNKPEQKKATGYYEFLPGVEGIVSEPPRLHIWLIPLVLALLLLAAIIWLVVGKVDIVSPAQALIIPDRRLQQVQARVANRVEDVLVAEGERVEKGQKLAVLFNRDIRDELTLLQGQIRQTTIDRVVDTAVYDLLTGKEKTENLRESILQKGLAQEDIDFALTYIRTEIGTINSEVRLRRLQEQTLAQELKKMHVELEGLQDSISFNKRAHQRQQQLFDRSVITREALEQTEYELKESRNRDRVTRQSIVEKNHDLGAMRQQRKVFVEGKKSELLKRIFETSKRLEDLRNQLQQQQNLALERYLLSPIDGRVNEILVHGSGEVVQQGETLLTIVPVGSPLQARAKVLNRDIGFTEIGQKVKVKMDSFNFTRYGSISGTVVHIADAAIEDDKIGSYYPVIINLDSRTVTVENNKEVQLKPGMTATVDIRVGKRRLMDYIIAPLLRYKDEALREK